MNRLAPRRWELRLGDELLAELTFESFETPWIDVSVLARPGLERFQRSFHPVELWPDADPVFDAMLVEVDQRGGFILIPDDGAPTSAFTLVNLDEHGANLRY